MQAQKDGFALPDTLPTHRAAVSMPRLAGSSEVFSSSRKIIEKTTEESRAA